jgi:hypothetical protein
MSRALGIVRYDSPQQSRTRIRGVGFMALAKLAHDKAEAAGLGI